MEINEIIKMSSMKRAAFANKYGIPERTLSNWICTGSNHREPPQYILNMLERIVREDLEKQQDTNTIEYWDVWSQTKDNIFSATCQRCENEDLANKIAFMKKEMGYNVSIKRGFTHIN